MFFTKKIKKTIKEKIRKYFYNELFPEEFKIINTNIDYLNTKNKNKKVVYTCLTGNYDIIQLQEYLDNSYDYVCFTDNKELLQVKHYGAWEIKPLYFSELNNHMNNRWHKTHPHILFPEYESSIYIDSNVIFLDDFFYKQIESKNCNLCIPEHYKNDCIYQEAKYAVQLHKISEEECCKLIKFLQQEGFPEHYGLNENNVIYRVHNDKKIITVMEEWWNLINNFCKRDQLSLSYVLWKNGITPSDISISNTRYNNSAKVTTHNHK